MTTPPNNFIRVSDNKWTLEESLTGKIFIPMGCNYYDPDAGGWPPKIWKKFNRRHAQRHFRMMEDLGVNAIRVFVSWASFMPSRGNSPPKRSTNAATSSRWRKMPGLG